MPRLFAWLPLLVVGAMGCGSSSPAAPSQSPPAQTTTPLVLQSGKIEDLQAARDIIEWNMKAPGGASYRRQDMICRWDLPVPFFIEESTDRDRVIAALDYWKTAAGMTYVLLASDASPRTLVRFGMDGLPPWGGARTVVDGTASDNGAMSGLVVYQPGGGTFCASNASANSCIMLYRHELAHIFGIFTNTSEGLSGGGLDLSTRELRMLAALYSLPHGARVESDGTWKVYGP